MSVTFDALLREKVQEGRLVESVDEMSEEYKRELRHIVMVSGDTELMSAPAYYYAARKAPSVNAMISAMAIVQDELGHAHIAYRVLEDLGVSREWLMYEREPHEFRYPYAFDVPLDSWVELCVANALYDQAGFCLLSDVHDNTSYGPWKRGLVKVGKEENFHLLHGRRWMKRLVNSGGEGRELVQEAVSWMFPMTVEWFGLPDDLKTHSSQLDYRMKGLSNDQLRQYWMDNVVPFCAELGLKVPVHRNGDDSAWELEYDLPLAFDETEKRWDFDQHISWDEVVKRWKARGPRNEAMVEEIQRSAGDFSWMFKISDLIPMPADLQLVHERDALTQSLWAALGEVMDPEVPVSLVDLGLIYDVRCSEGHAVVDLSFTATACPAMGFIQEDIRDRLLAEPGVDDVTTQIVWEPPWTPDRITETGRAQLAAFGISL